jgi:hypothetical protein
MQVRKKVKESKVDSELLYAYARTNNLGEIDAFLHTSHQANLQSVGDRCGLHCMFVICHQVVIGHTKPRVCCSSTTPTLCYAPAASECCVPDAQ